MATTEDLSAPTANGPYEAAGEAHRTDAAPAPESPEGIAAWCAERHRSENEAAADALFRGDARTALTASIAAGVYEEVRRHIEGVTVMARLMEPPAPAAPPQPVAATDDELREFAAWLDTKRGTYPANTFAVQVVSDILREFRATFLAAPPRRHRIAFTVPVDAALPALHDLKRAVIAADGVWESATTEGAA